MNEDARSRLSVLVLCFNSERTIGGTLASAARVSDDLHCVDSGSTDRTLEIVRAAEAQVVHHPFVNAHTSRNWAIETLAIRANADGTPVERQIHRRMTYYKAPPFLRAFALFFYRYVLKLGFLDGVHGAAYYVMQTLLYRLAVDAEIVKRRGGIRGMFRRNSA